MADRPDFLVIGAARSGTTLLCRVLGQRPGVSICEPKEPHFLAYADETLRFAGPGDAETINREAVTDAAAWRALFAGHDGLWGDGSVTTLYEYRRSIPTIKRHCPEAKVVVILRDPVDRAFSAYQRMRSRGYETLSFLNALDAEEQRRRDGFQHLWHYANESRYGAPVGAFVETFPPEQMLVLFYENLLADPAAELTRLHAHLDIEPTDASLDISLRVNTSGTPRSNAVAWANRRIASSPWLGGAMRRLVPVGVRERARTRLLRPEALAPEARRTAATLIGPPPRLPGEARPSWAEAPPPAQ